MPEIEQRIENMLDISGVNHAIDVQQTDLAGSGPLRRYGVLI